MLKAYRQTIGDCVKSKWEKYGAWRKLFLIFLILFLLFWASIASLFALPAITSVYFMTMIIKNIMDIHANWKWGSLLPSKKEKPCTVIGEVINSEEVFVKFPPKDPRTPVATKKQVGPAPTKPAAPEKKKEFLGFGKSKKQDDKKVVRSSSVQKVQGGDKRVATGAVDKGPQQVRPAGQTAQRSQVNQAIVGAKKDGVHEIKSSMVQPMAGDTKKEDKVFDMHSAKKEQLFDPSRESPKGIHSVKPEQLIDTHKEDKKGVAENLGDKKDDSAIYHAQQQKLADDTQGEGKKNSES